MMERTKLWMLLYMRIEHDGYGILALLGKL